MPAASWFLDHDVCLIVNYVNFWVLILAIFCCLLLLQLECCGAYNYTDFAAATVWNNSYTSSGVTINAIVPPTCCKVDDISLFPGSLDEITFDNLADCLANASPDNTNTVVSYSSLVSFVRYQFVERSIKWLGSW